MLQKPDVKTVFLEDADPTTVKGSTEHQAALRAIEELEHRLTTCLCLRVGACSVQAQGGPGEPGQHVLSQQLDPDAGLGA